MDSVVDAVHVSVVRPSPKVGTRVTVPEVVVKNDRGEELYRKSLTLVRVVDDILTFRANDATVSLRIGPSDAQMIQSAKATSENIRPVGSLLTSTNSKRIAASGQNSPFDANSSTPGTPFRKLPLTYAKKPRMYAPPPVSPALVSPTRKPRFSDPSEVDQEEPAVVQTGTSPTVPKLTKPKPLSLIPSSMRVSSEGLSKLTAPAVADRATSAVQKSPVSRTLASIFEEEESPDASAAKTTHPRPLGFNPPRTQAGVLRLAPGTGATGSRLWASGLQRPTFTTASTRDGDLGSPPSSTKRRGYNNPKNVCYCNATIQALVTCDTLGKEVLSQFWEDVLSSRNSAVPEASAFEGLTECFRASATGAVVSPDRLIRPYVGGRFATGLSQEDAHEFLIALFNKIETELAGGQGGGKPGPLSTQLMRKVSEACPSFDLTNFVPSMVLPTSRVFESILRKRLSCESCGYTRDGTPESFFVHSLDFLSEVESLDPIDVKDLLLRNLHDEKLSELKCEKCSQGSHARVRMSFIQVPQVLVLHAKRFMRQSSMTQKRLDRILLPKELDISPVLDDKMVPLRRPEITQNPSGESLQGGRYRLIAAVLHRGRGIESGHYVTAARVSLEKDEWCLFNDEVVSAFPADWNEMERYQQEVYMAFYQLIA